MYSTDGIVLKKTGADEANEFCVIYTKDFGKLKFLAQGVKKESAKLKGHLELYSLSQISFVLGKNGGRLIQARMLNFWPGLRQDLVKIKAARYLIELVEQNCLEGEKDEPLWRFFLDSLAFLEKKYFDKAELEKFRSELAGRLSVCLGYGGSIETLKKVR